MKKIKYIILLATISMVSCQEKLSEKTKQEIKEKQAFWQTRANLINKNKNIIPICCGKVTA